MPLTMAINASYHHPNRHPARLRAFVADQIEIVETEFRGETSQELSVGPVQFETDYGGSHCVTNAHGGWNMDGKIIWFVFNCKGAVHQGYEKKARKHIFQRIGSSWKFEGAHPWQEDVKLGLELQSVTRWRNNEPRDLSKLFIGSIVKAPQQISAIADGYIAAREDEHFEVKYVGTEKTKDEEWLFVESLGGNREGWIAKEKTEHPDEETLTCPKICFTEVTEAIEKLRKRSRSSSRAAQGSADDDLVHV